jgi:hypothetical protein
MFQPINMKEELKKPMSDQKINILISTLYPTHEKIKNSIPFIKISLALIPAFFQKITKDSPEFLFGENQSWLNNTLTSMITSAIQGQLSEDWLSQQLEFYGIKLFNAGFDGKGRCFNQAFGLLNSNPDSAFMKIKFITDEKGQIEPINSEVHQLIFEDYIKKNCEGEILAEACKVGDLVFYEKENHFNHVSLVIALLNNKIYLLSKAGSVPSMIHTHDIAKHNLGNIHFYQTTDKAKESIHLRKISKEVLNILQFKNPIIDYGAITDKKLSPCVAIDEAKGHVEIPCLTKNANEYFSRLQSVLGQHKGRSLITKNIKGNKALLPKFWLRELSAEAIDELSKELGCPKSILR